MATAILWCGFVGSWLLFMGPVYQAAVELRDHDLASDRLQAAARSIPVPTRVKWRWWLVPPVKLVLERRRRQEYQRRYLDALSVEDVASLMSFTNKAMGWLFVALGALILAIKETHQVAPHPLHFALLAVFMTAACVAFTQTLIRRGRHIVTQKRAA